VGATRRLPESLAPADAAIVVLDAPEPEAALAMACAGTLDVSWVQPSPAAPHPLLGAVRRRSSQLDGSTYVWGGAESHEIAEVRHHVRRVLGLPRQQVSLTGYWRRAAS
jgi:NADPH-dependent ferric siderophore reductase